MERGIQMKTDYVFKLSGYGDLKREQVAGALNKKAELLSRKRLPGLWSVVDMLNRHRADENTLKSRRIRYKIYGIILLLLGIFMLISGLMRPQEMMAVLLAGMCGIIVGIAYIKPRRTQPSPKMYRAADELMSKLTSIDTTEITFSKAGMTLGKEGTIEYKCIDTLLDAGDIYFITWNDKVTILKKADLTVGNEKRFAEYLESKTKLEMITL